MAKFVLEFDIEPSLIERIRVAAKEQGESVNEFALELLKKHTEHIIENTETPEIDRVSLPDWIKRLTVAKEPTTDFNHKKMYGDYIMKKYGA